MSANCPECDSLIDIDELDVDIGDELSCSECGALVRVCQRLTPRARTAPMTKTTTTRTTRKMRTTDDEAKTTTTTTMTTTRSTSSRGR